jgi:hypothetical protein
VCEASAVPGEHHASDVIRTTPRANRAGDLCPPWCTTDHAKLTVAGKPSLGYRDSHSNYETASHHYAQPGACLYKDSIGGQPEVRIWHPRMPRGLYLSTTDAVTLAAALDLLDGGHALADQVRAAAAIARDAK